ncbi:hypothetical protein N7471_003008 [Penicillium samsonianum]|uniref:uncharacterized protein n=1 Tax=Penicillium samsonianum TaxID=1882272 RepID=UPI002546AC1F|nr:uncharacterized protein N7471_003008 [Penicillium samsonianum]KAJ6143555.1 hypothetical protein N7471_003008 [Penicillium samsonianum]
MQDRRHSPPFKIIISLYIPRAYRHALIAPCFRSVRFSTSHHIEVNFALFLIFVFVAISSDSVRCYPLRSAPNPSRCSSPFLYS